MPVPLRTSLLAALAVLASIAVIGCGSTRSAPPSSAAASSVPAGSAAASSTQAGVSAASSASAETQPADHLARKINIGLADSGRSIQVRPGDELVLTLSSTYWHLQAPEPANVLTLAPPSSRVVRPTPPRCPPGQGCGTVQAVYTASQPGRTTITANRTSCGEARRCTQRQAHFQLTVDVSH